MFFGQKYILDASLRPLGLMWGPRELKNSKIDQNRPNDQNGQNPSWPFFEFKYLDNGWISSKILVHILQRPRALHPTEVWGSFEKISPPPPPSTPS